MPMILGILGISMICGSLLAAKKAPTCTKDYCGCKYISQNGYSSWQATKHTYDSCTYDDQQYYCYMFCTAGL